MAQFGLYPTPDHVGRSQQLMGQATQTAAAMDRGVPDPKQKKSVGGALQSGAGMASAGAAIGSGAAKGSGGGWWGAGIGALVGLGAYLLS